MIYQVDSTFKSNIIISAMFMVLEMNIESVHLFNNVHVHVHEKKI